MSTIFLDRDGVINYNRVDHVKSWAEFEFLPGSLQALASLRKANYRVFVVTNQAVINRGIVEQAVVEHIHRQMLEQISKAGGRVEAVLYCPHRPEENCLCRKPLPGLIKFAANRFGVEPMSSWLIGDHLHDIAAGQAAGCRTILVQTGRGEATYRELQSQPDYWRQLRPELHLAANLGEAVKYILSQRIITTGIELETVKKVSSSYS